MKVLSRSVILVILVLSLSILAQPQPGTCAQAIEWDLYGEGVMAFPSKKDTFQPAIIGATILSETGYEPLLFYGEITIQTQDKSFYNNTFDYTAYYNTSNNSLYITTRGDAFLSGTLDPSGAGSLSLQIPGKGITGAFTLFLSQ